MKRLTCMLLILLLAAAALCEESLLPPALRNTETELYYPSTDGTRLTKVRSVVLMGNDPLRSCLEALASPPFAQDVVAALPQGCRISGYENTFTTLTLSIETDRPVDETALRKFVRCAALTASLHGSVRAVNVLCDGVCIGSLLTEGISPDDPTVFDAFTLYLPDPDDGVLVPVAAAQAGSMGTDRVSRLLNALFSDAVYGNCRAFPAKALPDSWHYETGADGRHTLVMDFSRVDYTILGVSGVQKWELLSSLTMSCCTCLADTERVLIRFDGEVLDSYTYPDSASRRLKNGSAGRSEFLSIVAVPIQVRDEDRRPVSALLPLSSCPGAEAILSRAASLPPCSVTGVRICGDTAWVDLRGAYLDSVSSYPPDEERDTVYRMVNALHDNLGIEKVRFLRDGQSVETFAGSVCLLHELIYDPAF